MPLCPLATAPLCIDWSSYTRAPVSLCACPALATLNIVSSRWVIYTHIDTHDGSITRSSVGLVWPSVVQACYIKTHSILLPSFNQHKPFINMICSVGIFAVFPQIERGHLIVSWQISCREASESSGELLFTAHAHTRINEGFLLPLSLFPYIVLDLRPLREGLVVGRGWGRRTALLTTPTVSTWDQFIPGRAWTLINLSPPTALNIQFKGPAIDWNELPSLQTAMAHLFRISCLV